MLKNVTIPTQVVDCSKTSLVVATERRQRNLDHLKEGRKSDDSFQALSTVASWLAFTLLVAAYALAQLSTKAQPENVLVTLSGIAETSNSCCISLSPCLCHGNSTMVWTCRGRKQQMTFHLVASYEGHLTHTHPWTAPPIFERVFTFTFVTAVSCLVICFFFQSAWVGFFCLFPCFLCNPTTPEGDVSATFLCSIWFQHFANIVWQIEIILGVWWER